MVSMEDKLQAACAEREIPGAVLLATDRDGKYQYAKAFGLRSLKEPLSSEALALDSIMWIASCTKLMTVVSVMQCVERGLLKLDDDVTPILHELKDLEILTGFDEETGKPIMKKRTKTITLRHLLTHSSGLSYGTLNPTLMKWRASQGQKPSPGNTIVEKYLCPLLYEPGTSWEYSTSIDWAGRMVERVNNGVSLGSYMDAHVWRPLGIKDITFYLDQREDLRQRMVDMSLRDPPGSGKAVYTSAETVPDFVKDNLGGAGAFASAPEYLKILHSLLANDEKLLKTTTVDGLFKPQLSQLSRQALMKLLTDPQWNLVLGGAPLGTKTDWGLGGLLLLEDLPNWRRKGTMTWGGMPNLTWWIDREAGLCGIYASQILPPGDPKSVELTHVFEQAMYERYGGATARI